MPHGHRRIPLFPLPLVLFPGATLPLHIFEPRYRTMLSHCLAGNGEFGIVCVTGVASREAMRPGLIGSIAHIGTVEALPDGRSNIVVSGGERFAVVELAPTEAPYFVADVERFGDAALPATTLAPHAGRVSAMFARAARASRTLHDDPSPVPMLPAQADAVAFAIAQHIDLPLDHQQALLASANPLERLQLVEEALAAALRSLESRASGHTQAKSNGHGRHPHA